jgi:hypothetical protein
MTHRPTAWTVFYQYTLHAFARDIGNNMVEDDRNLWTFVSGQTGARAESDNECANTECASQVRDRPTNFKVRMCFIVMFLSFVGSA